MDRAKDGPELAVGGNKGVAILDAHSAEKIGQIQTESSVTAVCWMPAAKQLFLAQNSGIELWENDSDFQSQERQRIARTSLSATATCLAPRTQQVPRLLLTRARWELCLQVRQLGQRLAVAKHTMRTTKGQLTFLRRKLQSLTKGKDDAVNKAETKHEKE